MWRIYGAVAFVVLVITGLLWFRQDVQQELLREIEAEEARARINHIEQERKSHGEVQEMDADAYQRDLRCRLSEAGCRR